MFDVNGALLVLPSDLGNDEPLSFMGKHEPELIMQAMVRYCQEHGNRWREVPIAEFLAFEPRIRGVSPEFIMNDIAAYDPPDANIWPFADDGFEDAFWVVIHAAKYIEVTRTGSLLMTPRGIVRYYGHMLRREMDREHEKQP